MSRVPSTPARGAIPPPRSPTGAAPAESPGQETRNRHPRSGHHDRAHGLLDPGGVPKEPAPEHQVPQPGGKPEEQGLEPRQRAGVDRRRARPNFFALGPPDLLVDLRGMLLVRLSHHVGHRHRLGSGVPTDRPLDDHRHVHLVKQDHLTAAAADRVHPGVLRRRPRDAVTAHAVKLRPFPLSLR